MQLQDLIRRFRVLGSDDIEPYLWCTEDVTDWLNDGEVEACKRGRLLLEDTRTDMCHIALEPGKSVYKLHDKVYEIISLRLRPATGDRPRPISLKTREWLDAEIPHWREESSPACMAIQDEKTLRLVGEIRQGDRLELDVYRLPLRPMKVVADTPEIHEGSHVHLIQWAIHMAYSIPDADTFDPARASAAENKFTTFFGLPVDSDMRRSTRSDVTHHIQSYLS